MPPKQKKETTRVWISSKADILKINKYAQNKGWTACFKSEKLEEIIEENSLQLIAPMRRRQPEETMKDERKRCFLYFKKRGEHKTLCTSIDISIQYIQNLKKPSIEELHKFTYSLIQGAELVNINEIE